MCRICTTVSALVLLMLLVTAPATSFSLRSSGAEQCPDCEGEACDVDAATCRHGVYSDHCNRRVCARGPAEACGGERDMYGRCGDGMQCKCGVCTGCSLRAVPLQCYVLPADTCLRRRAVSAHKVFLYE